MRLDLKLACSTGSLIAAMFLSAMVARWQIGRANELSATMLSQRIPIFRQLRDLQVYAPLTLEVLAVEGRNISPAAAQNYHLRRLDEMKKAETALAELKATVALRPIGDEERIVQLGTQMTALKDLENEADAARDERSGTGGGLKEDLLSAQLVRTSEDLDANLAALVVSQRDRMRMDVPSLERRIAGSSRRYGPRRCWEL